MRILIISFSISLGFLNAGAQYVDSLWVIGIEGNAVVGNQTLEIGSYVKSDASISLSDSSYLCLISTTKKFIEIEQMGRHPVDSLQQLMVIHNSDPINIASTLIIDRLTRPDTGKITGAVTAAPPPPIYLLLPRKSYCRTDKKVLVSWRDRNKESRNQEPLDTFRVQIKSIFEETFKVFETTEFEFLIDLEQPTYDTAQLAILYSVLLIKHDEYHDRAETYTEILADSVSSRISTELKEFFKFKYPTRSLLIVHYLESELLIGEANLIWKEILETHQGENIRIMYESYLISLDLDRY